MASPLTENFEHNRASTLSYTPFSLSSLLPLSCLHFAQARGSGLSRCSARAHTHPSLRRHSARRGGCMRRMREGFITGLCAESAQGCRVVRHRGAGCGLVCAHATPHCVHNVHAFIRYAHGSRGPRQPRRHSKAGQALELCDLNLVDVGCIGHECERLVQPEDGCI